MRDSCGILLDQARSHYLLTDHGAQRVGRRVHFGIATNLGPYRLNHLVRQDCSRERSGRRSRTPGPYFINRVVLERGSVKVEIQLSPTVPPLIQWYEATSEPETDQD